MPRQNPLVRILMHTAPPGRIMDLIPAVIEAARQRYCWRIELDVRDSVESALKHQHAYPADGVLAFPTAVFRGGRLENFGLPIVTMMIQEGNLPAVLPDDLLAGRMAALHMQRPGWTIACYRDTETPWWAERRSGIHQVVPDAIEYEGCADEEGMEGALARLPNRTALIVASDRQALRVIQVLQRMGRRIGDDVRVIGFDNDFDGQLVVPSLSSIALPVREVAQRAVRTLADLMAGRCIPQVQRVGSCVLHPRASSSPMLEAPRWLRGIAEAIRMDLAAGRRPDFNRLASESGVSRSTLERHWRLATGTTLLSAVQGYRQELVEDAHFDGQAGLLGYRTRKSVKRMIKSATGRLTRQVSPICGTE